MVLGVLALFVLEVLFVYLVWVGGLSAVIVGLSENEVADALVFSLMEWGGQ